MKAAKSILVLALAIGPSAVPATAGEVARPVLVAERQVEACRRASQGSGGVSAAIRICEAALNSATLSDNEKMALHTTIASGYFTLAASEFGANPEIDTLSGQLTDGSRHNLETSVQHYSEALRVRPNSPSTYYLRWNRGFDLEILGRTQNALSDYDEAVRLKPDFFQGYLYRARVLIRLGRVDAARADLDRASAIAPYDPLVLNARKTFLARISERR